MLSLTRSAGEAIMIGDRIIVTVLHVQGGRVRLGINAPDDIKVRRLEAAEPEEQKERPPEGGLE
jgi:carbon storage regulator